MRVVFDIDGVLADFRFALARFMRDTCGYRVPLMVQGSAKHWELNCVSMVEHDDMWRRIAAGQFNWYKLESLITKTDRMAIEELRHVPGMEFVYVTSRLGPEAAVRQWTQAWLRDNAMPDYTNVVSSVNRTKTVALATYEDIVGLIDDDIRNIVAYHKRYAMKKVFLRDWAYNRFGEVDYLYGGDSCESLAALNARRVSSISEFCMAVLETIDGIDRG